MDNIEHANKMCATCRHWKRADPETGNKPFFGCIHPELKLTYEKALGPYRDFDFGLRKANDWFENNNYRWISESCPQFAIELATADEAVCDKYEEA